MKLDKIPVRRFQVELKHRPPDDATGEREEMIGEIQIEVPRLANFDWEKRWCALCVWNLLSSEEAKQQKVNQAFIFTAGYSDIIMRLEINPFQDEEVRILKPPEQAAHDAWHRAVTKKFSQLYGAKLDEWLKYQNSQQSKNCKTT